MKASTSDDVSGMLCVNGKLACFADGKVELMISVVDVHSISLESLQS